MTMTMSDAEAFGWYREGKQDGKIESSNKLLKLPRYDIYTSYDTWTADPHETGEFVRWDDVEKLILQLRGTS